MKRLLVLSVLSVAMACGPVRDGSNLGDPIYMFDVAIQGDPLPQPEGEYRVVFGWLSWGGGPWVDCVAANGLLHDCGRPVDGVETQLSVFNVAAEPKFPDGLSVPFYDFPSHDSVLQWKDSVFALGGMALYDDRNLNGELDPIEGSDGNSVDRLVAETIVTDWRTAAVFVEGRTPHPMKEVLLVGLSCPRAPIGYSVGSYERGKGCDIGEDLPLLMTKSDPMQIGRARCGGSIAGFLELSALPRRPPAELPTNAMIRCGVANDIFVSYDNGNFCDRYREIRYTLVSPLLAESTWDLRDDPPEYWRCEIIPGDG